MHVSALLEFDAVPLETGEDVTVLLDITAPERTADQERPPSTLQVVLDRSGSMAGGRLDGAVRALLAVVDRLDPVDRFGVVAFSHQAQVVVPTGPLTDKESVKQRIRALYASGPTDLSSGLLRGVQEARRVSGESGATLLLVSDGHANQGITEHGRLAEIARSAYVSGVAVTTIGYGLGYDEALLGAVADGGAGDALFAEGPDAAVGLIQDEADHLLDKTAQAASLHISPQPSVRGVGLLGGLPADRLPGGDVMVELGDFYSEEHRRLLVRLEIPDLTELGPTTVATFEVTYVDPSTLETHTAVLPVVVNVVPGSEAAARLPEPTVTVEKAYQEAQEAKHSASEALRRGDRDQAARTLDAARARLDAHRPAAPADMRGPLTDQVAELDGLSRLARLDDASRAAKAAYTSGHSQSRKRGSRQQAAHSPEPDHPAPDRPPGAIEHLSAAERRMYACLQGLALGDAFGDQFFPAVSPDFRPTGDPGELPPAPWRWTDDTLMACSVAVVLRRLGRIDGDALARSFAERFDADRKYGGATLDLLERVRAGEPWADLAAAQFEGTGSWGNGAAMRVAPIGANFAGDPSRAGDEAAVSAAVTHTHPEGIAGAIAVAVAASAAASPDATGPLLLDTALDHTPPGPTRDGIDRARTLLSAPPDTAARILGTGSRVSAPDTVPFALWAAATRFGDLPATARTTALAGGDRDTTSAIAAAIAAARTGPASFPEEWLTRTEPLPSWIFSGGD